MSEGQGDAVQGVRRVDAFPLCLDTKDPDEIVAIVKALAPTFGGINLEEISAPRCFEIERGLRSERDIPVSMTTSTARLSSCSQRC